MDYSGDERAVGIERIERSGWPGVSHSYSGSLTSVSQCLERNIPHYKLVY